MPNPNGALAGYTDPEDPNFLANLFRAHDRSKVYRNRQGRTSRTIEADEEFFTHVYDAARMRGINTTAYIRRAIAAMVAADLGMDIADITKYGARPTAQHTVNRVRTRDDAEGFGKWRIESLR